MSMTDLNLNFPNKERDLSSDINNRFSGRNPEIDAAPVQDGDTSAVCKYIVKAPRPDSKLILQNMEEVLNSVKKKHRQKHKKKREQRKLAEMEAAAVALATTDLEKADELKDKNIDNEKLIEKTCAKSVKSKNDDRSLGKRSKVTPLQEKTVEENGQEDSTNSRRKNKHFDNKSPLKTSSPDGDILRHFQRTPKKTQLSVDDESVTNINEAETVTAVNKPKAMNAFEVMMNARNKTIGSNTPGKEISPTTSQESIVNTKRKLVLQEWAERKGGAKRKLEEETRAAYVEHELENRAKRFKQMLVEGASPIQNNTPTSRASSDRRRKAKKTTNCEKLASQSIEKSKRKKRTTKRLISIDSTDNEEVVVELDAETEEFLSKLNSPTKKRDSILGYFPRKESPTDVDVKNIKDTIAKSKDLSKSETPKTRTRRSIKSSAVLATETANTSAAPDTEDKLQNLEQTVQKLAESTPSGRPKRSCAGKARYDYDLETGPIKLNSHSAKKGVTKAKQDEASSKEEVIIDLDDSNLSLSPEKLPMKLAPVFVRAVPKPSPDPVALKARQDFLMSGVPEKVRLEMEKQKQYEQTYEEELDYFPRVCHIQQLTLDDTQFLDSKCDFNFKFKPCNDDDDFERCAADSSLVTNGKGRRRRSSSNIGSTRKIKAEIKANLSLKIPPVCTPMPTVENKRAIIKFWKSQFDRFPTFKCYNQMREKYRFFSALDSAQDMEQVSESFVVTRRSQRKYNTESVSSTTEHDDVKPPATAPNGELLFTDKYKPMLVEQVLVNLVPVTQLRDFLATWVNGNGGSARNSQTMDDSFDTSNDSTSSISNATSNAVVLLGPVSSGKTTAVYALANDMNFNVLEINAGMKRTGKRLIQELQEATQSHQIRKDSTPAQSASKARKNLLRMSLNGQKLKKQNSQNQLDTDSNGGCNADITQNTRKCLILIEDADVVFDQLDSGFTDAIYTLAASSKRPVIVMATNPNCLHLQRLMNQNTICFTPPNALNISRFMAVLSLMENCPTNLDDLVSLYLYNGKDLRRTLLELQFFIQSGGDRRLTAASKIVKNKSQQRTPQEVDGTRRESGFFASPTKRRLSDEDNLQQSHEQDEQLVRGDNRKSSTNDVYIHRSLFEYFTCNQNEQWRIPFPVDFSLLRVNLSEMFQCSQRLQVQSECVTENSKKDAKIGIEKLCVTKRKTRTPVKTCNNSSITEIQVNHQKVTKPPLDVLCDFYENISIAALIGTHNADMSEGSGGAIYRNGITGGGADIGVDRLMPHLSEHIAHGIVEEAISVNLEAKPCPYNLFNTRTERLSLCDYVYSSAISSRSQRTRALDVEPALRAICRSEKQRAMQERRSTRFYHYLRHSAVNVSNFSIEPFDKACSILQLNSVDGVDEESSKARD